MFCDKQSKIIIKCIIYILTEQTEFFSKHLNSWKFIELHKTGTFFQQQKRFQKNLNLLHNKYNYII